MQLYQVDAFTQKLFRGNPAGVCLLDMERIRDSEFLQNIAAEMNLSETAFLAHLDSGYRLRWFTPLTEVQLCGHATLSAAHILWESGIEKISQTIRFETLSGSLFARYTEGKIELNFPVSGVVPIVPPPQVIQALGIRPVYSGKSNQRYFFEIDTLETLKNLTPDFTRLKEARVAFIVTCHSEDPEFDFYSRFFAPGVGINEDPVTGSSHTALTPYWSAKLGKNRLKAYQASRRGGVLECETAPDGRVLIRGYARTVFDIRLREE
jgi:PhzF family phenazine biosynthesis protein